MRSLKTTFTLLLLLPLTITLGLGACASAPPAKTVSGEAIHAPESSRERCWSWIVEAEPDYLHWELLLDELSAEPEAIQVKSVRSLALSLDQRWPDALRTVPGHWRPEDVARRPHQSQLIRHLNMTSLRKNGWFKAQRFEALPPNLTTLTLYNPSQLELVLEHPKSIERVEHVTLMASNAMLDQMLERLSSSPIGPKVRTLNLLGGGPSSQLERLSRSKFTALEHIELKGLHIQPDHEKHLSAFFTTYGAQLKSLHISRSNLGPALLEAMKRHGTFSRLESLELSYTYLPPQQLALLTTLRMPRLTALNLSGNPLTVEVMTSLAKADVLSGLKRLNLRQCHIDDKVASWLGYTTTFSKLEQLDLSRNQLSEKGIWTIFGHGKIKGLRELDLNANPIQGGALVQLARAKSTSELTHLDARWLNAHDQDIEALAAQPTKLKTLLLTRGQISAQGARALAQAPWYTGLKILDLSEHPLGDEGTSALFAPGFFPRELSLHHTRMADAGLMAFLESDAARLVEVIDVRSNAWGHESAGKIGKTRTMERLMMANMRNNAMGTPDNLGQMASSPSVLHLSRARVSFDRLDLGDAVDMDKAREERQLQVGAFDLATKMAYLPKLGEDVIKSTYLSVALRRYIHMQIVLAQREMTKPGVKEKMPSAVYFMAENYIGRMKTLNLERMPPNARPAPEDDQEAPDHSLEDAIPER